MRIIKKILGCLFSSIKTLVAFIWRQCTRSPRKGKRKQARKRSRQKPRHNVYVVLLDKKVRTLRKVRELNPDMNPSKQCVYVGSTGLSPTQRFANHKKGYKASKWVKRYGVRLLPPLYSHLNPMSYEDAAKTEASLAQSLRVKGYTVLGGH
jgi:hypothetical protein